MVLSSVLAIGHFLTPSESKNINAESVEYVTLPFDCFDLTTLCYKSPNDSLTLGNAKTELGLPDSNSNKDLQTYAIIGLKPSTYTIQNGSYTGQTLGSLIENHPYIELPMYVNEGTSNSTAVTKGVIVGLSYVKVEKQYNTGYESYNSTDSSLKTCNRGALSGFDDYTIKGVRIPKTYYYIGQLSFADVSSLEEVLYVNNEVGKKYFGISVFSGCVKLKKSTVLNSNYILPSEINQVPMNTFKNTSITDAYIPNTFKTISSDAFRHCVELTNVTFEKNPTLSTIYSYAFENCVKLSNFDFVDSITTINIGAFQNNFSLKNITIPTSVTKIGNCAFYFGESRYNNNIKYGYDDVSKSFSFDSPRTIVIASDVKTSIDFGDDVFGTDNADKGYTKYNYVYYAPEGDGSLVSSNLENLCSTDTSAQYINKTNLNAEYKINQIKYNTYSDYKDNKKNVVTQQLNLDDSLFGSTNAVPGEYNIGAKLVVDNDGLSKTYAKYEELKLSEYVFKGWSIELYIGDEKVETINVDNDNDIVISNQTPIYTDVVIYANYEIKTYKVKFAGETENVPFDTKLSEVFSDSYLYNGDLDADNLDFVGMYSDSKYTTLVDWESVVSSDITMYKRNVAFANLYTFELDAEENGYVVKGLKSNIGNISQIYIPATYNAKPVIGIGDRAFIGNSSITRLYFADFDKTSDFTIGSYAFQGCINLTYAELPASNLTVKNNAFINTGLTSITLLGSSSFDTRGSYDVSPASLPNGCKILRSYDDANTDTLKAKNINVVIDVNGTEIKYSLFPHHFLYLPSANDEITYKAGYYFVDYSCRYNLGDGGDDVKTDHLESGNYYYSWFVQRYLDKVDSRRVFFTLNTACKFEVDESDSTIVAGWSDSYEKYVRQKYNNDSKYFETIDLPENITGISDNAFQNDSKIKKLILNSNLTQIGGSAFDGCVNLREIVFPTDYSKSLSIYEQAFQSTLISSFGKISNTTYVKLADLKEGAFRSCTKLQSFYMSADSTLLFIDSNTFNGCTALQSITIPKSVTTVGLYCFANTTNLKTVQFAEGSNLEIIYNNAFTSSGITNINLGVTKLQYVADKAFSNTNSLKNLNLYNIDDRTMYLGKNVFSGSSVETITINLSIDYYYEAKSLMEVFANALSLKKVFVHSYDQTSEFQNYNNDGIVYSKTSDTITLNGTASNVLAYEFIPFAYTGTLTIPSCVKTICGTDGSVLPVFNNLKNITAVVEEANDNNVREYIVLGGDLYKLSGNNLTLAYVPNYVVTNSTYTLLSSIDNNGIEYKVVGVSNYALNSNSSLKVLQFEENANMGDSIPVLYSDNIEAVVIPKFVLKITEQNFKNLTNLRTIKVANTITDRGNALDFANSNAITNAFYNNTKPVFIVPSEDLDVYTSSPNFGDQTVRSLLNVFYNVNNGTSIPNTEFEFGAIPVLVNAQKIGYDFVGWYVDAELTTPYNPSAMYADLNLFAKYNIHMYTYTYMVDDTTYYTQEVPYGSSASGPESNPTKTGKVFVCWKTADGVEYSLDKNQAISDVVLYAEFKTDNKFITKIIVIAGASLFAVCVVTALIVKSVKKKKAYKK